MIGYKPGVNRQKPPTLVVTKHFQKIVAAAQIKAVLIRATLKHRNLIVLCWNKLTAGKLPNKEFSTFSGPNILKFFFYLYTTLHIRQSPPKENPASSPSVLFHHLFQKSTSRDKWHRFFCARCLSCCSFFAGSSPAYSGPQRWDHIPVHLPRERELVNVCDVC